MGLPFRKAHEVVGHLVLLCEQRGGCRFEELSLYDFKNECDLFEPDIVDQLDMRAIADARTTEGGTGRSAIREQMTLVERSLEADMQIL